MIHFQDRLGIQQINVEITLYEGSRIVAKRGGHNIWTNVGRNYVVKFLKWDDAANWGAGPAPTVAYMGIGIGSNEQIVDVATTYPALDAAYPGQNVQDDSDPTIRHLERPVLISGTNTWLVTAVYDEPGSPTNPSNTTAIYSYTFGKNDINISGQYGVVPVSEVCLCLSDETPTDNPYTGGVAPSYVGTSRQVVVAFNGFASLAKTVQNTLKIQWELRA
jgi:hypothetical protein